MNSNEKPFDFDNVDFALVDVFKDVASTLKVTYGKKAVNATSRVEEIWWNAHFLSVRHIVEAADLSNDKELRGLIKLMVNKTKELNAME